MLRSLTLIHCVIHRPLSFTTLTNLSVSHSQVPSLNSSLVTLHLTAPPDITALNVPDGVTSISIANCTQLTALTAPSTCRELSLNGCPALLPLSLPTCLRELDVESCALFHPLNISELLSLPYGVWRHYGGQ